MVVKAIQDEDFVNYKLPSMFIATCFCDWKCAHEGGFPVAVCQNSHLANSASRDVNNRAIVGRYMQNPITSAIVFGGLEPFCQTEELEVLIRLFREDGVADPIVIYTGYEKHEIETDIQRLQQYPNIIVKFGRYRPGDEPHFDPVLGVKLASDNQYAEVIS